MTHLRAVLAATVACVLMSTTANALEPPKGDVVLTITAAKLDHPNVGATAQFDMAMLDTLAARSAVIETPWTDGKSQFSGPLLRAVLEAAGAHGPVIKVVALNDYSANVPYEDAATIDTMLATRMNGKLMSVRDKGPLFLIYPFDKDKNLYNEKYFARSVWQIRNIEVVE